MIDNPMFPASHARTLDMSVPVDAAALSPELTQVLQEERERMAKMVLENLRPQTNEQLALEDHANFMMSVELRVCELEDAVAALQSCFQTVADILDRQAKYVRQVRTVMAKEGAKKAKTGGSHV